MRMPEKQERILHETNEANGGPYGNDADFSLWHLGYGFPGKRLWKKQLEQSPDAIVVDAGSTDAALISWARHGHRQPMGRPIRIFPC